MLTFYWYDFLEPLIFFFFWPITHFNNIIYFSLERISLRISVLKCPVLTIAWVFIELTIN